MIGTNMTGMAKAIQEAKVSPVPSPNLWMRVSGTTRFGGEPVQGQSRKSLGVVLEEPVITPVPPILAA